MTHAFTEYDVARHIAGLKDSADLIDAIVAANERNDDQFAAIGRNVQHIEIMCAMQHIKDSGADLKPYTDAAARGAAWLAQN